MFTCILASLKAPRANPTEAFSDLLPNPRPSLKSRMKALLRLLPIAIIAGFLVMSYAPPPSSGSTSIPSTNCQPPSLENCYTEAQMKDYLYNVAIPYVDQFSKDSYSNMSLPQYVYIPEGQTNYSKCGDQVGENTYEYCPSDDTVYIGQKMEWTLYNNYGAIAPVFALAHEFGHHIQSIAGVPNPTNSQEMVNHENQADCIAGAWVLWADQKQVIDYPKDLQNIDGLMYFIRDTEGPNQTHGTASERTRSFELGHSSGLSACNSYYPDHPILT